MRQSPHSGETKAKLMNMSIAEMGFGSVKKLEGRHFLSEKTQDRGGRLSSFEGVWGRWPSIDARYISYSNLKKGNGLTKEVIATLRELPFCLFHNFIHTNHGRSRIRDNDDIFP